MDLISIDDLKDEQLDWLMAAADAYFVRNRNGAEVEPRLHGKSIITAFFEDSTRTLMSFEVAARRLGGQVTRLPVERSSMTKGESLKDTIWTLQAMSPSAFVIRHNEDGAVARIAGWTDVPVINGGDGAGQHPTQGLLDVATIRHKLGRIEGLKVAICGDIRHSRVANSTAALLKRMGAEVRLAGPAALMPAGHDGPDRIDEAIEHADVVMMLRIQRERLEAELNDAPGEYLARYGLTEDRVKRAAPQVLVMHPGPMNRGVEIADSVADGPRSIIRTQVEMGVAMRMAVLQLVTG